MITMNVVGAGMVGKTLAVLLSRAQMVTIGGVVNRSFDSARRACEAIGQGRALASVAELPSADVYLLGTSDDAIVETARQLSLSDGLDGAVVFHCSGSLPSALLSSLHDRGATTASVHPIKSFAEVESSAATFAGTFCGVEGDDAAVDVLVPLFEGIGARILRIDPENKTLYHAAIVFAMNYFVTLVEVGLQCYEKAGIDRHAALELLRPILTNVASNVVELGPAQALTGPIARGDVTVVERQMAALGDWNGDLQRLYAALGHQTLQLSQQAGSTTPEKLGRLEKILSFDT